MKVIELNFVSICNRTSFINLTSQVDTSSLIPYT